jgi:ketosteroid isomerase-like protein
MSNEETVGKIYEAFGRGDVGFILDQLADDVAFESWSDNSSQAAGVPWMTPRTGPAGVAEFFTYVGTQMEIADFQVLDVLAGERQVGVEVLIEAKVSATGGSYRDEELHLWTFGEDGKVTRMRHYTDTAKHIAAAQA